MNINPRLNLGGAVGAILTIIFTLLILSMLHVRFGLQLAVPTLIPGLIGALIGNASWTMLTNSAVGRRFSSVKVIPENDDEPGYFDGDKAARRREIAERWAKGNRLEDD